ncbi:MAG TPA: polysaccharide deacetylase family protein [Kofleriaceae bacterium]|nr:polysaccharide deacetylase family protein [Kofleriaceae bacterium]
MVSTRTRIKNAVFDRVPGMLRRGPAASNRVALTFDDGPDRMTGRYLDLLDDLGVPATFFVVGELAAAEPAHVRDYLRRGHQLGGHGFDHTRFTRLSRKDLLDQCSRTERAIGGHLPGRPWVRPPHGSIGPASLVSLVTAGYTVAMWSMDSCDHSIHDADELVERCSPRVITAGDVVLFHEGQEWTLQALPRIVTALQAAGLECVTMHDLFS